MATVKPAITSPIKSRRIEYWGSHCRIGMTPVKSEKKLQPCQQLRNDEGILLSLASYPVSFMTSSCVRTSRCMLYFGCIFGLLCALFALPLLLLLLSGLVLERQRKKETVRRVEQHLLTVYLHYKELQFVIMGTHSGFSLSLGIVCWSTPASKDAAGSSSSSSSTSTSNIA